jgi:hypothetical protein
MQVTQDFLHNGLPFVNTNTLFNTKPHQITYGFLLDLGAAETHGHI